MVIVISVMVTKLNVEFIHRTEVMGAEILEDGELEE